MIIIKSSNGHFNYETVDDGAYVRLVPKTYAKKRTGIKVASSKIKICANFGEKIKWMKLKRISILIFLSKSFCVSS